MRERFLELARRGGSRYLVVDATRPPDEVTAAVRARLEPVLPLSATQQAEIAEARRLQEEERRVAEAARLLEEARAAARRRGAGHGRGRPRRRVDGEDEQAALEQRRREAEREAEEQARLAAAAAAEQAAQDAQREAQRASELEDGAVAGTRSAPRARGSPTPATVRRLGPGDVTAPLSPPADPPTRELSLADELFGVGDDDDDRTVQLPQVRDRDDR